MSLAETIKQTLRSDLQSEDVSRGVVDRDTPGAFPETPALEDRNALGEPAGGLGGATADPTGARGSNMQKGLVPEVPFREGSDEAKRAQAPSTPMTDSGIGLPNGHAEAPVAPQDEQPVETATPLDTERPRTPPATVRPTSPALAAMRASDPDVSQTLAQNNQTTLPIRERRPLDEAAAAAAGPGPEAAATEKQRPHRRSLSQGAGTYNSVIGHGSGEEPTASHRLVPHTGDDEVAIQAMTAAAGVPQGSGVYNGVIGHGSNIDDASEARRSLSRHSGDADSSRRRGSRPGSHGSSTLEDVPEGAAAGGAAGGVAAHTLPSSASSSQQRGGDVTSPQKPETGAFDLYQPASAAPHDRHARDMSLTEQPAGPAAPSVRSSEHSIPNDTHFRTTSTTMKESPDAVVDDAHRPRLGSEGGMTAAGAAAGLAGGAASSAPPQHTPQTMEEVFRPLSHDETSSLSSTLSGSQQPPPQQQQSAAAAGGFRKPGQSVHSPSGSVDAASSSHFRSASGASSLYSQQPPPPPSSHSQPREYRPLDSAADAHYKERGAAVPSAADADQGGQGPYRTLGSGTPSGVQI